MAQDKLMWLLRQKQILSDGYTVEEMEIFLQGFCSDRFNPKIETARAIRFIRTMHGDQKRDDGRLYIYHPLWMACMAIGLGLTDDTLIAITLLHDICEDTNAGPADDLPFDDAVNNGVHLMTFTPPPYAQDKLNAKIDYYDRLTYSNHVFIVKALDRLSNLTTAIGAISRQRIVNNIIETHQLLLPRFSFAKEYFSEYAEQLFFLENIIRAINNMLACTYGVDLTQYPPII